MFIMLEGTDGSGKSLQTELLIKRLRNEQRQVEQISFPQYGEKSAALVEDYLNGKFGTAEDVGPYRASILYAVDRYAASKKIKNWLKEGKIVIANRYVASNMGHQGGKIQNADKRRRYFAWIYDLEYNIFGVPKPDINIILHVPAEIAQKMVDKKEQREYLNGKKRDIHEDDLRHLKNAEESYLEIANLYPEYAIIECVNNGQLCPPEEIHKKVWTIIEKTIIATNSKKQIPNPQ